MQTFMEQVTFTLRALYDGYGYSRYSMSKFEEYDLYARNKDFLISDGVITFTDTDGKLMALKPDVTLSIVKNTRDIPGAVQKLYYNENVYRVSQSARSFRELMQVGLECIGNVDDYCICEVLTLAAKSLETVSKRCVLEISHLGLLAQLLDSVGLPREQRDTLLGCIGQKNLHELTRICAAAGVAEENIALLRQLLSISGRPAQVLSQVCTLLDGRVDAHSLDRFARVVSALDPQAVQIDFSVVDDVHYYNGFVFKGFIDGIPHSVLSGGQYDKLMKKMGRASAAIGFAIYMDDLERLEENDTQYDVDTVLLYRETDSLAQIRERVEQLRRTGSVLAVRTKSEALRCRQIVEVSDLENHA